MQPGRGDDGRRPRGRASEVGLARRGQDVAASASAAEGARVSGWNMAESARPVSRRSAAACRSPLAPWLQAARPRPCHVPRPRPRFLPHASPQPPATTRNRPQPPAPVHNRPPASAHQMRLPQLAKGHRWRFQSARDVWRSPVQQPREVARQARRLRRRRQQRRQRRRRRHQRKQRRAGGRCRRRDLDVTAGVPPCVWRHAVTHGDGACCIGCACQFLRLAVHLAARLHAPQVAALAVGRTAAFMGAAEVKAAASRMDGGTLCKHPGWPTPAPWCCCWRLHHPFLPPPKHTPAHMHSHSCVHVCAQTCKCAECSAPRPPPRPASQPPDAQGGARHQSPFGTCHTPGTSAEPGTGPR